MAIFFLFVFLGGAPSSSDAQLKEMFREFKGNFNTESKLSTEKIIEALKEALRTGTENAVAMVSKQDGYLKNEAIKILLPPSVKKTEAFLRAAGYGPQLEAFEESMNRAAERAAPIARDVFWESLKDMSISDAEGILKGDDYAATTYFKEKTFNPLFEQFKPVVNQSMHGVGVTKRYLELVEAVKKIPFAGSFSFNLDDYVTKGSLEGLFTMLAREEKKIRNDPSARVTDILKEVFGKR
ncbi:MAG: DUF4197 domain-containing protein [Desulfobacteraceae bacterium]|nr:MAG: DUF4197 domain-containing protein [Desulfobacteraceae bacterium]